MIIAPGKRGTSDARGYGHDMICSFFPSGLARLGRAKPEGKKEVGLGGILARAAASAAGSAGNPEELLVVAKPSASRKVGFPRVLIASARYGLPEPEWLS